MTSTARPKRKRQHATAARQALRLCESELLKHTGGSAQMSYSGRGQPRIHAITARSALRAAGVPPDIAAALRRRLHLMPEQAAE